MMESQNHRQVLRHCKQKIDEGRIEKKKERNRIKREERENFKYLLKILEKKIDFERKRGKINIQ